MAAEPRKMAPAVRNWLKWKWCLRHEQWLREINYVKPFSWAKRAINVKQSETYFVSAANNEREQSEQKYHIMSKIQPLADRVLVKPMAAEEKTIGGIIIPDSAKEKPLRGEVIAVGEGTKDEKMLLSEGDTVLYGKYAGTELEYDGEKYLIMRQSDVLAILK